MTRTSQFLVMITILSASITTQAHAQQDPIIQDVIQKLRTEIETNGSAYADLTELTSHIGSRISGSPQAALAVEWATEKMRSYGFDHVTQQAVTVPHWVRGSHEQATITTSSTPIDLKVSALGMSAGTSGVEAEVIEVHSLEEVRALGAAVRGKIVFFNRPMDPTLTDTFEAYGGAVDQRSSGPSTASSLGAVATLVRSMTTMIDDDHPHTGITRFRGGVTPIPAAALSTRAADTLSRQLRQNSHTKVKLELSAQHLPDVTSYNVIGEIVGREIPNEIVLVGGHLDSWDLAQGAQDDGAGVVQSLEVCRAIRRLGRIPKRTVRCVLFMAEEFGGIGAGQYAAQAQSSGEKHIAAVESDRGGFAPDRVDVAGSDAQVQALQQWLPYLQFSGLTRFAVGGAGTDVAPLAGQGALTMDFVPVSTHYFDIHHSALDRIEAVNPDELKNGASALAGLIYLLAENSAIGL